MLEIAGKTFSPKSQTMIMGILNITPDSFSDGGLHFDLGKAISHVGEMIKVGADIIDIGGESARAGALAVSKEEELKRVIPLIKEIKAQFDTVISIDTYKAEVAEEAILAGADLVNNIKRADESIELLKIAAKYDKHICIMHNQDHTNYENDIIEEIIKYFIDSINLCTSLGIKKDKIILDPGIGFGKTPEQNIEVLGRLKELRRSLDYIFLLGASRKSYIGHILKNIEAKDRLIPTLTSSVLGVNSEFDIIRVHDVKENFQAIKVADAIIKRANYDK